MRRDFRTYPERNDEFRATITQQQLACVFARRAKLTDIKFVSVAVVFASIASIAILSLSFCLRMLLLITSITSLIRSISLICASLSTPSMHCSRCQCWVGDWSYVLHPLHSSPWRCNSSGCSNRRTKHTCSGLPVYPYSNCNQYCNHSPGGTFI